MSNTKQDPSNQENKKSKERTSLEILGGKRLWDKAGTGFSMPFQKPSQPTNSVKELVKKNSTRFIHLIPSMLDPM